MSLPNDLHVTNQVRRWFNEGAKMFYRDRQWREGIDLWYDKEEKRYYVLGYHALDDNFSDLVVFYSNSFSSKFNAMVVHKKFKDALYSGAVYRMVEDLKKRKR